MQVEVHIVVKGDTLWKIARQYGIPFEELKRVNAHLANPDYIVPVTFFNYFFSIIFIGI